MSRSCCQTSYGQRISRKIMKNMLLMKIKYCWPSRESEKCWFLGVAVLVLGIGHIGIHLMHKKEIEQ